jgi:hypothetical protein
LGRFIAGGEGERALGGCHRVRGPGREVGGEHGVEHVGLDQGLGVGLAERGVSLDLERYG